MENVGLNETGDLTKHMSDLDILSIDANIRKNFEEEFKKLPIHREKLCEIEASLQNDKLRRRVKVRLEKARDDLLLYIEELVTQCKYNFYVMETVQYIEEYKQILKTPIKVSFMGKASKNYRQKSLIIDQYLEEASKHVDIKFERSRKPEHIRCNNCPNKKEFDIIDGNIYVCTKCYSRQIVMKYNSSYNDIDRINIASKYMYDPKIHFRDCIKQYQGKQNCTILDKVYNDLEEQFFLHHLLHGDKDTPKEIRFQNITKKHIMIFLKELNYSNHYENVHLIHYNFTCIKPDDISYLEDQLLDDFDILIELYHKRFKHIKRKNFINTQYVLYQLLRRHRHHCNKEDFIILKTIDRKFFHDEICKILFEELGLILAQVVLKTLLV